MTDITSYKDIVTGLQMHRAVTKFRTAGRGRGFMDILLFDEDGVLHCEIQFKQAICGWQEIKKTVYVETPTCRQ